MKKENNLKKENRRFIFILIGVLIFMGALIALSVIIVNKALSFFAIQIALGWKIVLCWLVLDVICGILFLTLGLTSCKEVDF